MAAAFEQAVAALADAGVQLVHADPGLTSSVQTWATIATAEARWAEAVEYEQHPELLSQSVLDYLAFGEQVSAEAYIRAQYERERIHAAYAEFFARTGAAALFTPTVGCVAFDNALAYPPRIGGVEIDDVWRDWAPMLYDANLAGLPACTVPDRQRPGRPAHRRPAARPPAVRPPAAPCRRHPQPCLESPHRSALTGTFPQN